jgi:SpoVK/Ycf46/Vps4 family AAA+-type ATPase/TM2 domain-containing membrane protein YozV
MSSTPSLKSKNTTVLLALFLGAFGAQRFYIRKYEQGITSILICWTFIPFLASIYDVFFFMKMDQETFDETYNRSCPHCGVLLYKEIESTFSVEKRGKFLCKDCLNKMLEVYNQGEENERKKKEEEQIAKKNKKAAASGHEAGSMSEQYYQLLNDFSGATNKMAKKIEADKSFNNYLEGQLKELGLSISAFVTTLLVYDLYHVLQIVRQGDFSPSSLEGVGLALAASGIVSGDGDPSNGDYKTVALSYNDGLYTNVAESMAIMADITNPLDVTVQEQEDGKIVSSEKVTGNLCLPAFLKATENALFEEYATFLYRFATIISKADNTVTEKEEKILGTIYQMIYNPIPEKKNEALHISQNDNSGSLEEVLDELNALIGLDDVKAEIGTLVNFIKVQKAREASGLKVSSISYHIVFTGNPGTGKTTVARIVAKIYKHLGILTAGHLVETDRSGLIAEYSGQTAVKVNKTVDSALNGVLFIDEAYALVGENKDDFGKEAVATLIKRMEDNRDKLVLILAGYTKEMTVFIDTNPGFESRFNRYVNFPDYTARELFLIFESQCKKLEYTLTAEAATKLRALFENAYLVRDNSFGNGRFARNIFEKAVEAQANRISREANLTKELLTTITDADITAD